MADAQDLKSCDLYRSYRFDPGLRHQSVGKKDWAETYSARSDHKNIYKRRGVEQLVARRAHNPEVEGSSPFPATTDIETTHTCVVFYVRNIDRKDLNLRIRERGARFLWTLAQREVLSGAGRGEESATRGVRRRSVLSTQQPTRGMKNLIDGCPFYRQGYLHPNRTIIVIQRERFPLNWKIYFD